MDDVIKPTKPDADEFDLAANDNLLKAKAYVLVHIESVPLKQLTKKEALALSKKFHKQTIAFLKMMKRLDRLSKRKPKHPIYFGGNYQ